MFAIRRVRRRSRFSAVNIYRNVAAAVAAGAACLSLAACSAGITTTTSASAAAADSSRSAAAVASSASAAAIASASASASRAAAGRMVSVTGGSIGRFPVPTKAKVAENIAVSSTVDIMFGKVTPAEVQSFYAQALPKDGYTITSNSSSSESGGMVLIQFTGHGYTGEVTTMAKASSDETLPGLGTKDITAIILQHK